MITVVTAVPGSGKTLYVVEMIDKIINSIVEERKKENPDLTILNRHIYHNIDGLVPEKFAIPEVLHLLPDDNDWRKTPDGSLVVYDEAWQFFPVTSKRDVDDPILSDLAVHRHTGHDIVFITQHPSQLHTFLRRLGNVHIHLYRMFGAAISTVYTWQHVVDSPNSRSEQERSDKVTWKFPKKYYSYYKSASAHTHKFRLPRRITFLFALAFLILSYVAYRFYNDENSIVFAFFHGNQNQEESVIASDLPVAEQSADLEHVQYSADEQLIPEDSPYLFSKLPMRQ